MSQSIENALDYNHAIEIIPNGECLQGLFFLRKSLIDLLSRVGDISPVWLKRGGIIVNEYVCHLPTGDLPDNPIWMSHTGPRNEYLPDPICRHEPRYVQIVRPNGHVPPIVLIDNVVESKGSFSKARDVIVNGIAQYSQDHIVFDFNPDFYYLALVSKITGDSLPNLTAAFWVNEQIWVHGLGCDDEDEGRGKNSIWGRLKPNPDYIPPQPYYKRLFK